MAKAGMATGHTYRRLLIDDVTYLALQRDLLPFHQLGVLRVWTGSIDDPVRYLVSRHSDGVVVACANLPKHMAAAASRSGGICAISRRTLAQLSAPLPRG